MTTQNILDWDAVYQAMCDAGFMPVKTGWKYRYKQPAATAVYTKHAKKSDVETALKDYSEQVRIIQLRTDGEGRVTVQQRWDELDDDVLLI